MFTSALKCPKCSGPVLEDDMEEKGWVDDATAEMIKIRSRYVQNILRQIRINYFTYMVKSVIYRRRDCLNYITKSANTYYSEIRLIAIQIIEIFG